MRVIQRDLRLAEAVVASGTARQLAVHVDELLAALAGLGDLREVSFLADASDPAPSPERGRGRRAGVPMIGGRAAPAPRPGRQ
ncbi:hypothetical protein ACFOY4_30850 [Actinomadura syzygii]|uniref:Uncharacterized protein n=1 Tax=Actinomadura syzygii TaxID=1427538 RepID=A0A5D0TQX9_9ACTN|nr:hypothetical protein [Actinomadura syzygii]TYC08721.1 hypothetical protein FXF65_38255 [Actinomadura syzygii]